MKRLRKDYIVVYGSQCSSGDWDWSVCHRGPKITRMDKELAQKMGRFMRSDCGAKKVHIIRVPK